MKTIAIDFDGVIANYREYQGYGKFGLPIDPMIMVSTLTLLKRNGWRIIIYTARSEIQSIADYLHAYNIPFDFINHNPENAKYNMSPCKPKADVYLDDKAITFDGNWGSIISKIENFKPWWKK